MLGEGPAGREERHREAAARARNSPEHEDEAGGGDCNVPQPAGAGREQVLLAELTLSSSSEVPSQITAAL